VAVDRLFGMETEYAVSALRARGVRVPQSEVLDALMDRARERLPHLADDHSSGIFLESGARFYVDAGGHPELTTPECSTPGEVVRFIRAGERTLLGLTGREQLVPGSQTVFYRSNVDYSGTGSTWGCHESYMHRADPGSLPVQLIPHLVSRVVYTGAGGFDNVSAGVKFTLSPRATHVHQAVSDESTSRRGIYHTKNEPLSAGSYNRLHITFGESLCSDLAIWLKVGTTALVVALCEAGLRPGETMTLDAPVAAVRLFAGDPTASAVAATASGKRTAVAIQRHYLVQVEARLGSAFLPPWAGDVCRQWRWVLDRLDGGPEAVATTLDWAIKLALFRDHVRRRGLAWESLGKWTTVAERISAALGRTAFRGRPLRARFLRGLTLPIQDEVQRLQPEISRMGLDWNDFGRFLEVRDELFELDTRFGQLGEHGLFTSLDRVSVLTHRVDGSEGPVDRPPSVPRARIRGQLVRELSGDDERYCCDWEHVWDCETGRCVDLGDPFVAVAEWKDVTADGEVPTSHPRVGDLEMRMLMTRGRRRLARDRGRMAAPVDAADPIAMSERARQHRMRGQLAEAEQIFRQAIAIEDARVPPDSPKRPHRRNHLAMVLLRAGRYIEASRWNAEAWRLKAGQHDLVSGRILFVRTALRLLQGDRDVRLYLGQLKTVLRMEPLECRADIATTWDIPDVLDTLCEMLRDEHANLLVHVCEALNDRGHLATLEELEAWRTAETVALEVAWPER
jgi:proteasome accessory factor A